ncbi:hypothetical protein TREES_T100003970 [Tupaia chinensis]|uniref:Uncharacterized protein n=1 Tax=Tupaia chinensis TaxID=246437 RepID=L9KXM4_TUPCH|nr:hypothetical protein TREES_T100003970 [Tupaia chinensis]
MCTGPSTLHWAVVSVSPRSCVFPHYCPPGSGHPRACSGGSEALNGSGLRVSEETGCHLCEAGTYRSRALDTLPCQPCPPGFSCPQGSETYHSWPCPVGHYCPAGTRSPRPCPPGTFRSSSQATAVGECQPCPAGTFSALPGQAGCLACGSSAFSPPGSSCCTCRGLNRVFQKSDGSCICEAGHVSYDNRGLESEDGSDSEEDCQPLVAERCSPGDVRLAATRQCVSPQRHDCASFCRPVGGELSADLGISQCREYTSAEELCDTQCLAGAPRLFLTWGPSRELILSVKSEAGESTQREVASTVGPDQLFQGSARVHLVQFGPHGISGLIISSVDMLDSVLLGYPEHSPQLQSHRRKTGLEHPSSQDLGINPHIPNPVLCLVAGDAILFQLHILPHNRSASHYPVYQKQHLFNSNPQWDFGAFRRLGHLVRETHLNFSRFAHQFLDPGTYVFHDNGLAESIAVVLVKEEGAACDPSQASVQPSSPYQLGRLGVLRHRLPHLSPDWAAITGVLLAVGLATVLTTGLGLLLRPSLPEACPMRAWRPRWRSLGQPHVPAEYVLLRDSLPFYEDLGPRGSGEGADSREKAMTQGAGVPLQVQTLEDFSVRTLYDKLEDQSLHVAAQLSKHRSDALAFYRAASRQLQGLQDLLQGLSATDLQVLGRGGDPKSGAKAIARTDSGQHEEPQGGHTTAAPGECGQPPPGGTPSVSLLGFQPELNRAIAALASALSRSRRTPAGVSRKVKGNHASHAQIGGHVTVALVEQHPTIVALFWAPNPADKVTGLSVSSKASGHLGGQLLSTCQQDELVTDRPLSSSNEERQNARLPQDPGLPQLLQGEAKGGSTEDPSPEKWIRRPRQRHGAIPELQVTPSIFAHPAEACGPYRENPKTRALKSDQDLLLEVRRVHLAQRIEDLEWELSLLLQVADGRSNKAIFWLFLCLQTDDDSHDAIFNRSLITDITVFIKTSSHNK